VIFELFFQFFYRIKLIPGEFNRFKGFPEGYVFPQGFQLFKQIGKTRVRRFQDNHFKIIVEAVQNIPFHLGIIAKTARSPASGHDNGIGAGFNGFNEIAHIDL
jgi:hypothetical protein